jgi:predicted ATP-grasp superfamily ATP-dependent carboligase
MRLFVYEYLSSGMASESAALSSLDVEGRAMLGALLLDFSFCDGVRTETLLDSRWRTDWERWPSNVTLHFPPHGVRERAFDFLTAAADFTVVIAPEIGGILARLAGRVEDAGGHLLGPSLKAIRSSADKALLTSLWEKVGVPVPRSSSAYPLVYKPRFGAGSQATFLIRDDDELAQAKCCRFEEGWHDEMFLQPYVHGLPASVAFLAGPSGLHALPAVEQRLSSDGRLRYLGGRLPLPPHLDGRARSLGERAAQAVPGWLGWFGVDLILGDAEDGSEDVVIEINPRLTTSYLGLRRLARFNLAQALLAVAAGSPPPIWDWRSEPIVFGKDGTIQGADESFISPG